MELNLSTFPVEFRRRNMYVEGDYTITGQHLPSSVGAVASLDACREAFAEEWPGLFMLAASVPGLELLARGPNRAPGPSPWAPSAGTGAVSWSRNRMPRASSWAACAGRPWSTRRVRRWNV